MLKKKNLQRAERSLVRATGDLSVVMGDLNSIGDSEMYERVSKERRVLSALLLDVRVRQNAS